MSMARGKILIATAVVALAFAAAAPAHLINELTIGMAKHEAGPYTEMNPVVTVARARSLYFKAINNGTAAESITLTDVSAVEIGHLHDYRIRWYKGSHEVTSQVFGSGYDFKLPAGRSKVFRALVKPKVNHPGELCVTGNFHENSPLVQDRAGGFYVNSTSSCG